MKNAFILRIKSLPCRANARGTALYSRPKVATPKPLPILLDILESSMSRTRHASANEEESEIDLTPMLDVVFIMLIFFIVTASFIKEYGLEINRPDDAPEVDIPTENQNVLININASSEILVDQRRVDVRSVRSVIQRKLAENPKGSVIISAHSEAKANTYAAVADAAQQAKEGIGITLVVKEE